MDSSSEEEDDESETPPVRIPLGHSPVVFAMPGSLDLAKKTLRYLAWPQGLCSFKTFANGEIHPKVDQSVTNHDVFILIARNDLQSEPNFSLIQLFLFIAALRGESPNRITVVQPCLDYARQDRRLVAGESIAPKLMLDSMKIAGADRYLTIDLHNEAEAAFSPPGTVLDELTAYKYLADFVRGAVPGFDPDKVLVCATNGGGMMFTRRMADELCTGFIMAVASKAQDGSSAPMKFMSSAKLDTAEIVIIVDDMFDTCGSLAAVCKGLHNVAPNAKIYGIATHGYFSGKAHLRIKEMVESCALQWVAVTNSVAQTGPFERLASVGMDDRLKVIDVSRLLAGAILRIHLGTSVNLPKFRGLGPADLDPVLEAGPVRDMLLERHRSGASPSTGPIGAPPAPPPMDGSI